MNGRSKGFSLVEIVVVMAVIALALTVAGPRIGAGMGRLELEQAAQSVRSFIKLGRVQAQRTDRQHFVVIDRKQESITLLDPEMQPLRTEVLPSSVHIVLEPGSDLTTFSIAPSGIVRGESLRLRGRVNEIEIPLQ